MAFKDSFVMYEDFGAIGDGVIDDLPAICEAHAYVNAHNLSVRAKYDATYHLGSRALTAIIVTDTDWNTARFTLDDTQVEDHKAALFEVRSLLKPETLQINQLTQDQKQVEARPERDCHVLVENDGKRLYIRRGLNQNQGVPQHDCFILHRDGSVEGAIDWNYDIITRIEAYPIDEKPLVLRGGVFTTFANRMKQEVGYNYWSRNIEITRSNTEVDGLTHYVVGETAEVRDFPQPEPDSGQVVIEMKVAGLCGSDLHKYHSSRAWAQGRQGMISGHEPAGVVAEVGPNVDHLSAGDRVCIYHRVRCGHCMDCRSGNAAFCADVRGAFGRTQDGSHADYMLTDARYCLPLPDEISFAVATQLACTAGTSFSALRKIPARAGDTLVVFGLGPVGLSGLLLGMGMGYHANGVDVHPYRVELAKKVGKGVVINAQDNDPIEVIRDITDGKGVGGVLECSGSPVARRQAASVAGRGATVVYVGVGNPELVVSFEDVLQNDITIRSNSVYSMASYYDAVEFLLKHPVPLDEIVTHRFKIEQAVEAFSRFDTGETGKVIFEWDA